MEELFNTNGYRFYLTDFSPIPTESANLLQLCLENGIAPLTTDVEIRWCINSQCQASELIEFNCAACDVPLRDSIVCTDSAGYELWLQFTNLSSFGVNSIHILGGDSVSMTVVEAMQFLIPEGLLLGDTSDWLLVPLSGEAELYPDVCLDISTQNVQDSVRFDCCQSIYCVPLPACDRCCQDEEDFVMDVAAGFDLEINGLNEVCSAVDVIVRPIQLTDCDETLISRRRIGETTTISLLGTGNQVAEFNGVPAGGFYEFCLSVTRTNFDQEACFEDSTLSICDTVLIDCVSSDFNPILQSPTVFPNPTNGQLWLKNAAMMDINTATLLAINGQQVHQQLMDKDGGIDISHLPPGVYILLLGDDTSNQYYQRLVKQ